MDTISLSILYKFINVEHINKGLMFNNNISLTFDNFANAECMNAWMK